MRIIEYDALDAVKQGEIRDTVGGADWSAAKLLRRLLEENTLKAHCGPTTRLLLGMEGEALAAFCTLAERDEVETDLTPWIGFVYTFPEFRGRRRSGELIEHACALARRDGHARVYVSTNEVGLYEKYGFTFLRDDRDRWGGDTRVYVREI